LHQKLEGGKAMAMISLVNQPVDQNRIAFGNSGQQAWCEVHALRLQRRAIRKHQGDLR
jgi:hypothetical protein